MCDLSQGAQRHWNYNRMRVYLGVTERTIRCYEKAQTDRNTKECDVL